MVCDAGFASGGLWGQASITGLSGRYQGYTRKGVYRHQVNLIPRGPQMAAILEPQNSRGFSKKEPNRSLATLRGDYLFLWGTLLAFNR